MTSPATARPHSQGRRSLGSTYRQQDAFFRDHTQSRPAVTRFDDEEEQEQVVIYEVVPCDDETELYKGIESQEVLEAVFEIFKDRNQDLFNFVD